MRKNSPELMKPQSTITMYSTTWCGDCVRAKRYLQSWGLEYSEINIEKTPEAAERVMKWANGKRVVPTITVDGKVLINPRMHELAAAVGVAL